MDITVKHAADKVNIYVWTDLFEHKHKPHMIFINIRTL